MSNKEKFMYIVNAFVVRHEGTNWPSFREDLGGTGILCAALDIPDDTIPDDYAKAAGEFCEHVTHLRYDNMYKPKWLPNGIIDYKRFRHKDEWEVLGITE